MTTKSPHIASRDSTADRLLDEAATLFWRQGYAATTTRQLASALGIQKASLYHHITSKEELLFQISLTSLHRITSEVISRTTAAEPSERIAVLIRTHLEVALTDRDLHATMLTELRSLSAEHRAEVLAGRDAYQAEVRAIIEAEQLAGRLRASLGPEQLTLAMLNLLNWSIFWYRADGEDSIADIAELLRTVFLDGARDRSGVTE